MGVLYPQASFKNSRVASRKATTQAATKEVLVLAAANTLINKEDRTRTYLTLRNGSGTTGEDIYYDYFNNPAILTTGFLIKAGEAVDLEAPNTIYARGSTVNVLCYIDQGNG